MTDYLQPEEVGRFLEEAAKRGARDELLCRILVYTGMRIGECLPLACGDIDVTRGRIELNKALTSPQELLSKPHGREAFDKDKLLTFLVQGPTRYTGEKIALKPKEAGDKWRYEQSELVKYGLKASQPARVVPLTDRATLALLAEWIKGKHVRDYIFTSAFGKRLSKVQASRVITKALLAAGIDRPKAHPHNLRHTFAVASLKKGVPLIAVQRQLGHTKMQTTALYLRFVVEDIQEAYEKAGPLY